MIILPSEITARLKNAILDTAGILQGFLYIAGDDVETLSFNRCPGAGKSKVI